MTIMPFRVDVAKAIGDLRLLLERAQHSPELHKAACELYDAREPLFEITREEVREGVFIARIEPTGPLRRLAKRARRLSLSVVPTSEGAAP